MRRSLTNSNAHFRKASAKLPMGVSSNFRFWGEEKTLYVDHGRGAHLWDIDGNKYIDYRLAYGPNILGYADPRVDEAAREGIAVGGVFALSTELEYDVACRISKMVPAAEMVRFSNSGTEAVMAAMRLARAYTGKDSHVIVEGGYHGIYDSVLWYSNVEEWDPALGAPPVEPESRGVPKVLRKLAHLTPLNDANHLEHLLRSHGNEIGAFLIEPIMGNCCALTATAQYLLDARALCDKYDVVMIIDEVKTGFRVRRGGVQELMGVTADLCTFAKAIGNGYPISAVAGREDIMMQVADGVKHGGTYTCHSVALAAANRTLQILDETPALDTIAKYGDDMNAGMGRILEARGIPHCFTGHGSMSGLFFSDTAPTNYRDWLNSDYTLYDTMAPKLHELGILCEPDSREPWFVCEAHDQACLDQTLHAFEIAIDETLEELDDARALHAAAQAAG